MLGLVSTVMQYTLSHALSLADISILTPFDFSRLVFTALFAYVFFQEPLSLYTAIGSAIIIGSAAYIAHRETALHKTQTVIPTGDN